MLTETVDKVITICEFNHVGRFDTGAHSGADATRIEGPAGNKYQHGIIIRSLQCKTT